MLKNSKIYVAGHNGMVGSAITRNLLDNGYINLVFSPYPPFDLTDQKTVADFFAKEKPEYVFLAAAKVGGIVANNKYRAQFIYENLMIQNNIIHQSYKNGVKKLLFLGSSCIYPKDAPQPIKEESLLTDELEYTNEPYAIAKIAGIKMCESYNIQYGTNFISVMPTNLYGPNDNYNLETSHVLPAMIRKMHLAKCLENNDWQAIRNDLKKNPIEGINERSEESEILKILGKYGIRLNPTQHPLAAEASAKVASAPLAAEASAKVASTPSAAEASAKAAVTLTLWGTGTPYREFLYVDDVADACVFLMNNVDFNDLISSPSPFALSSSPSALSPEPSALSSSPSAIKNTHINIGTGKDLTIKELAYKIKAVTGFQGHIHWDESKPDGTFRKLLDVTKINNLGWKEKVSLDKGLEMIYSRYIKRS